MFCRVSGILGLAFWLMFLALPRVWSADAPKSQSGLQLSADTSRPEMSTFIPGEKIEISFAVTGLAQADKDLKLLLHIVDEHDKTMDRREIPVVADGAGHWRQTVPAPNAKFGFCRVYAKLSNGVVGCEASAVPKLGSRAAGCLTYCVVPDPAQRPLFAEKETFFGMQGGFSKKVNILPYLGIRWVLGGYTWRNLEPNRPGEFVEKRTKSTEEGKNLPEKVIFPFQGKEWKVYTLPCLFFSPKWAVIPETDSYCTGTLTPEGEKAWRSFCQQAARAYSEDFPDREEHVYQITWEPVYPWGFKGTDEQLIRVYEIAYPALHEADPKAVVIGPTGSAASTEWNIVLFKKGLGRYLDGFSIHPYIHLPAERNGFVEKVRALKEGIRQYAGRDLPMFGTEQGSPTREDPSKELDHARGLMRANLILLGEGYRFNFGFYIADYPKEPGYGYYYNLNPKIPYGTDKIGPKPIAPAYAAQSFLLEGYKSAGPIEWLGETALGYAYERAGSVILALWDYGDQPRDVTISVGAREVEVFDWMGNKQVLPAPDGTLKVTLTPEPVYIKGVSPAIWSASAKKPLQLDSSRLTGYPGGSVTITGRIAAPPDRPIEGRLVLEPDERLGIEKLEKGVALAAGEEGPFQFILALPGKAVARPYPIKVTLNGRTGGIAAGGVMLRVLPPVSIERVEPAFAPQNAQALKIVLKECQGRSLKGTLQARIAGVPESEKSAPFSLLPQKEVRLTLVYDGLEVHPAREYQAVIAITTETGYRFEQEFPVDFLAAYGFQKPPVIDGNLSDWANLPPVTLKGKEWGVRSPQYYSGTDDLWAALRYGWDGKNLYLAFDVHDDVYAQENTGFWTWKGDSLQLGLDLAPTNRKEETGNVLADVGSHRWSEIELALTRNGPEAYRGITHDKERFPVGLIPPEKLKLAVVKDGRRLIYEAAIPWETLGANKPPKQGDLIGISATVNDMDDPKQLDPSAVGIFGGIVPTKDPNKFGTLYLGGTQ